MGISRMGVYVDAPNGRNYLYLLSATHVPGATFEQRPAFLPTFVGGGRGSIELRPLLECLLGGTAIGALATDARDMLARTRVSGDLQPGDGTLGDDRMQVELTGRARGRNRIQLAPAPAGAGIVLRVSEMEARAARFDLFGTTLSVGALAGALSVHATEAHPTPSVSLAIAELTLRDIACRFGEEAQRREAP
jgi:hypothetical protein